MSHIYVGEHDRLATLMTELLKRAKNRFPLLGCVVTATKARLLQVGSARKWKRLSRAKSIKLELGSGAKKGKNGWTTIDLSGADINYDLRRGIPLRDDSVEAIYSSHLLEHIPYPEILQFISECRRVLKPSGHFSVCVPDASKYIRAYVDGRIFLPEKDIYDPARVDTGSDMDQVNYIAYMAGHHSFMFDQESLINLLKKAGFMYAVRREFDQALDSEARDFESIYAIAKK